MTQVTSLEQVPSALTLIFSKLEELSRKVDNNKAPNTPADELLNIDQAAKFLDLTKCTIYGLIRSKKIPYMKPTGRRIYFSKMDLEKWVKASRKKTANELEHEADQWLASMAHK